MQGVLFDQPHVIAKAHAVIEAAGLEGRCQAVVGNYFEAVPTGVDAYSLCNVIGAYDRDETVRLLAKCREALGKSGRLLIIDRLVPSPGSAFYKDMAFFDLFFLVLMGGHIPTEVEHERGLHFSAKP